MCFGRKSAATSDTGEAFTVRRLSFRHVNCSPGLVDDKGAVSLVDARLDQNDLFGGNRWPCGANRALRQREPLYLLTPSIRSAGSVSTSAFAITRAEHEADDFHPAASGNFCLQDSAIVVRQDYRQINGALLVSTVFAGLSFTSDLSTTVGFGGFTPWGCGGRFRRLAQKCPGKIRESLQVFAAVAFAASAGTLDLGQAI
jgi:hypothetical protein